MLHDLLWATPLSLLPLLHLTAAAQATMASLLLLRLSRHTPSLWTFIPSDLSVWNTFSHKPHASLPHLLPMSLLKWGPLERPFLPTLPKRVAI